VIVEEGSSTISERWVNTNVKKDRNNDFLYKSDRSFKCSRGDYGDDKKRIGVE
jgi:hypothetical protein